jgi:hypothetical protein
VPYCGCILIPLRAVGWSFSRSVGWLVGRLVGRLVGWPPVGQSVVSQLVCWLVGQSKIRVPGL